MKAPLLALAIGVGVGCAGPSDDSIASTEEPYIIGPNDLVKVSADGANVPQKYRSLLDAFGFMSNGCTVTHIGHGLAITAGHCVGAQGPRKDDQPCPEDLTIWWGRRGDRTGTPARCTLVLTEEQNWNRDYAILQVDTAPSASVTVDAAARPPLGTIVTSFGHPRRRPLEWSKTCGIEPASAGGPIEGFGLDEYSHQCDTEGGSSGSTMLRDDTLAVVGIHGGGNPNRNWATFVANTPVLEILERAQATSAPTDR